MVYWLGWYAANFQRKSGGLVSVCGGGNFELLSMGRLWVVAVMSKTSKACSEALRKIISTTKQLNAPKICAIKNFPGKLWADQSKEFAGEFGNFCKKNCIEIYSSRRETKSAAAERYIRTLKTIIFKYLHERDTNRFIDKLEKFVSIINTRISHMTKLAPIEVPQKHVPYLIFFLQYCATTTSKVQIRQPSSHSKENWNNSSWLQGTVHWRAFYNFTHTYKKSTDVRCEERKRRNHTR